MPSLSSILFAEFRPEEREKLYKEKWRRKVVKEGK